MGFLASDHDLLVLLVQMSSQCYCLILVFGFLNLHYSHFSFNMSNITATSNCFFFCLFVLPRIGPPIPAITANGWLHHADR